MLQKSEASLQAILQATNDGILAVDKDGKVLYSNRQFANIWNIPQSVLSTKDDKILINFVLDQLIDPKAFTSEIERLYKSRENSFDTIFLKDGKILERTSRSLLLGSEINGRVWSFSNVTEDKRADQLLEESESRFHRMFENGQFGIILVDSNNRFTQVNPAFCKIVGYSKGELLKMKFSDITTLKSIEKDIEAAKKLKEGKISSYTTEKEYIKKDGGLVWVKIVVSVLKKEDDTFDYFLTMVEDITLRKKKEIDLQENEEVLNESQKIAGLGTYSLDVSTGIWESSKVLDKIFGIDASYIRSVEGWGQTVHPEDRKMMLDYFKNIVLGKGEKFDRMYRITRVNDKMTRWVHGLGRLAFDKNGHPIRMMGTIQDITESKTIQEELIKLNDKFSNVFQSSPYAITITRVKDGKFIDVNKEFESLSGVSKKKALNTSTIDLGIWNSDKDRANMLQELKTKGFLDSREFPFVTKDRGVVTGLYSARMININGEPHILSSIADISTLKAAQEKISELESRNEATLTSIGDAVFSCDKDGNVLLFNKAAEKLTGIPAHQVIGKKYNKVITFLREADEKPVDDFVLEVIKRKEIIKNLNHTLLVAKTGAKIPVMNSVAPITKPTGDVIGCVVSFRDVSHEREIDRAKTEFVSLASHQLRTPLTAINWYCEMLLSEQNAKLTDKQKQYARETYKASKRMVLLMDALLNVSRLEMGSLIVEPTLIKISDIIKIVLKDLESEIAKKNIVIKEDYDSLADKIKADPKLLAMVIENIVSNAVKYTSAGGGINLTIKKIENNIIVSVKDSGIGIPDSDQEKVFEKLFRAENAKQIDPDGTGLGLYLVKTILDNSGGKIWFKSQEGTGSTFNFSLPVTGMKSKRGTKTLI